MKSVGDVSRSKRVWLVYVLLVALLPLSGQTCGTSVPITPAPEPVVTAPPPVDATAEMKKFIQNLIDHAALPPSPLPDPGFRIYNLDDIGGKSANIGLPIYWVGPPDNPDDALTKIWSDEYLNVYWPGNVLGYREFIALLGFELKDLPNDKWKVDKVELALFTLPWAATPNQVYPRQILDPWSEDALVNNQKPASANVYGVTWSEVAVDDAWSTVNITKIYLKWLENPSSNRGVELSAHHEDAGGNLFCSTRYPEVAKRPKLIIHVDFGPPKFHFPLNGDLSTTTIADGGHFGDYPWRGQYCTGDQKIPLVHTGVDLKSDIGDPVYAVEAGTVAYVGGWGDGWASVVVLEHTDGYSGAIYQTLYGHVDPHPLLVKGMKVNRGSKIATVADINSGPDATPHLHFSGMWGAFSLPDSLFGRAPASSCSTEKHPEGEVGFGDKKRWDPKKMFQ